MARDRREVKVSAGDLETRARQLENLGQALIWIQHRRPKQRETQGKERT